MLNVMALNECVHPTKPLCLLSGHFNSDWPIRLTTSFLGDLLELRRCEGIDKIS